MSPIVGAAMVLLADCPAFWDWAGVANQADALTHIKYSAWDEAGDSDKRPGALFAPLQEFSRTVAGVGQSSPSGVIEVRLFDQVDLAKVDRKGNMTSADRAAEIGAFGGHVDAVLKDLQELGQTAGYLLVQGVSLEGNIMMDPRKEAAKRKAAGLPVDMARMIRIEFGADSDGGDVG